VDWTASVASDGRQIVDAARAAPDAPVPACEGWTLADLAVHVALVHQRTAYLCRTGDPERPSQRGGQLERPPDDDRVGWAARWHAEVVEVLRATPPDATMWSFFPGGGTARWWARRMAHETAVHRVDAEQALGRPVTAVPADLAIDGVDEVLEVFVPTFGRPPLGDGETVHLHSTDADGEWLLTLGADGLAVERGHAKGDAAVRGPASAIYLWLWGRAPVSSLEVLGDASVASSLREAVAASTA
jgi:uncharacterized protein (TIGR03083 family)